MRILGSAVNITARSSSVSHISDVGAGKKVYKNIAEVPASPVDQDLHGKEVSSVPFDPRMYSSDEIWLTIFQVDELTSPLRAVS